MPGSTDAKVTFGEWDWTDEDALFIKQPAVGSSATPTIWTDYLIHNRYEKDGHIYMLGGCSPGGFGDNQATVSFVQLASPTLLWITDWTASRFNAPPNIPDPDPDNSDWVLLDIHFDLANLTVPTDGKSGYYRISGTYYYGHKKPPRNPLSAACWPRPPWLDDKITRTVPAPEGFFEKNLINPVKGTAPPDLVFPVILPR